ncbi:MAG: hypothetical protein FD130_1382 [Halothiobacillaceae bacterium]|nr:MAG: hypothetical protein FD130_1382 [Halothiobacillaceae bacterium]
MNAQFYIGQLYHEGKGVAQNYKEAAKWYQRAADQGHPTAQNNLGFLYANGLGVLKNFELAYKWLNLAAAAGHKEAIKGVEEMRQKLSVKELAETEAKLGWMYYRGWSVTQDSREAAGMYAAGDGVAVNYPEAEKWYNAAALQGHPQAQYKLGELYKKGPPGITKDLARAYAWFYVAAEAGVAAAQTELLLVKNQLPPEQLPIVNNRIGVFYLQGLGVTPDYQAAKKWFELSAKEGYMGGQYNLGLLYQGGLGVKADDATAVEWYLKAAQQGHALAQNNLGVIYQKGINGKQNNAEAIKWYRKSAEQGVSGAQTNLGVMYYLGVGVPQSFSEAQHWLLAAAKQGHARAYETLGRIYYLGHGVEQNNVEAYKWLTLAADAGDVTSKDALAVLKGKMSELQVNQATRLAEEWRLSQGKDQAANSAAAQ